MTTADQQPQPYPEHDKLRAISEQSQAIGEFIDWLRDEQGYRIEKSGVGTDTVACDGTLFYDCEDGKRVSGGEILPYVCSACDGEGITTVTFTTVVDLRTTDALAEFFDIDQAKIETEKRAMLDELRASQR